MAALPNEIETAKTGPMSLPRAPRWRSGALMLSFALVGACSEPSVSGPITSNAKKEKKSGPPAVAQARISPDAVLDKVKPIMSPLPQVAESPENPLTEEKITLGRMLYFDPRLSKNHDVSCNTCHNLENFGIDDRTDDAKKRLATSLGHRRAAGDRNSPTVYNAALHFSQFWDGRAANVEEQAKGPILNPVEMAMADEPTVVSMLKTVPGYVEAFKTAFPGDSNPITYDNLALAIGAFERKLMTSSRFDKFLGGDLTALNQAELHGLEVFVDAGCPKCHGGAALGGSQYQKLGVVKPWEGLTDRGRGAITRNKAEDFYFKVPSLRNITKTGPYLHDGSIEQLDVMVRKMAEHQTNEGALSDEQVSAVVAFLGALEGELPTTYIAKPELPKDGSETPAPDPA